MGIRPAHFRFSNVSVDTEAIAGPIAQPFSEIPGIQPRVPTS